MFTFSLPVCLHFFISIGSLEELDQELGLDETIHGNAAKVKDLVEKLKSQTEKDRRKRQQRIEKKGIWDIKKKTLVISKKKVVISYFDGKSTHLLKYHFLLQS